MLTENGRKGVVRAHGAAAGVLMLGLGTGLTLAQENSARSLPITEVTAFKDGHALVVRSGTVRTDGAGDVLLDELPQGVARAYYHWFFLAQPAPFPETLIGADPDFYFESCLTGWDSGGLDAWDANALAAYRNSWRNPAAITGMCNDYRAAIDFDFALDAADLDARVTCPALVLFGADGMMARAYDVAGTWADRFADMRAQGLPGGHFFPDLYPDQTAAALLAFLPD